MIVRHFLTFALLCVVVSMVLLPAGTGRAYTLKETDSGAPIRWNRSTIHLWIAPNDCGPTPAQLRRAVVAAAAAWSEVGNAPRVVVGVGHPPEVIGYDPRESEGNGVYVLCDGWPHGERAAVTVSIIDPNSGALLDTDIVIDGRLPLSMASPTPQTAFDLQSIVTHEVGHVLGLDESEVRGATMNTLAMLGDSRRRSLAADDEAAIDALYGVPYSTATSCAAASTPGRHSGVTTLAFFAVVLVVLRRRFRNAR